MTNLAGNSRVFVSYAYDNEAHTEKVERLSAWLRNNGVEAILDQWVSPPPSSWPSWMDQQIELADFVLVVASKAYYERAHGTQQSGGLGATFEYGMVLQNIYDAGRATHKYLPVAFSEEDIGFIPRPLNQTTRYMIGGEGERSSEGTASQRNARKLYARLTGVEQSAPPLGSVVSPSQLFPTTDNAYLRGTRALSNKNYGIAESELREAISGTAGAVKEAVGLALIETLSATGRYTDARKVAQESGIEASGQLLRNYSDETASAALDSISARLEADDDSLRRLFELLTDAAIDAVSGKELDEDLVADYQIPDEGSTFVQWGDLAGTPEITNVESYGDRLVISANVPTRFGIEVDIPGFQYGELDEATAESATWNDGEETWTYEIEGDAVVQVQVDYEFWEEFGATRVQEVLNEM
jgi:hypothetical protein